MGNSKDKFKIGLFGFNKKQVDDHIKNITLIHKEKIEELKYKLLSINDENQKFSEEIKALKEEMKMNMKSEKLMKFALKKAEELVPLIHKTSNDEISKITLLGEKREAIFNEKIKEYNNIIKSTQEQLNFLLKKELEKSESLSQNVKKFIKNKYQSDSISGSELSISIEPSEIEYSDSQHTDETINPKGEDLPENLEEDANLIRNKYLIGKISGEDLIDNKGNIIVSKDSIITEAIINKAEKEQKLAELIVNMKL